MNLTGFNDLTCFAAHLKLSEEIFLFLPAHVSMFMVVAYTHDGLYAFLLIPAHDAINACFM